MNVNTLTPTSPLLTPKLIGIQPAPKRIHYRGNNFNNILQRPTLTVVGSRRPTSYGIAVTEQLVKQAGPYGITILSGLALGIDSVAHQAALACGLPTIAIMPAGLDTIAPASHRNLAEAIVAAGGALVSEYPLGHPVYKQNFVARDRLMAAFGYAVLITEAAAKSGTMHTASFALDIGRPVLAVPGPITSALSEGTNNLIKVGAIPATTIEDILQALNIQPAKRQRATLQNLTGDERTIMELLRAGLTDGTSLQLQSKLPADRYNQTLTMLEINGLIRSLGADQWMAQS